MHPYEPISLESHGLLLIRSSGGSVDVIYAPISEVRQEGLALQVSENAVSKEYYVPPREMSYFELVALERFYYGEKIGHGLLISAEYWSVKEFKSPPDWVDKTEDDAKQEFDAWEEASIQESLHNIWWKRLGRRLKGLFNARLAERTGDPSG